MMATPPSGKPFEGLDSALGFIFDEISSNAVRGRLEVTPSLLQPAGLVHGGVYAAFAESAASAGTSAGVAAENQAALGISNSTSLLRPVSEGTIGLVATPRHQGRTTWVWDVEMSDSQDRLCALSRVTIAVR